MQKKTEPVDQVFAYAEHLFQLAQNDWTPFKSCIAEFKSNHGKSIDDRLLELIIEEKAKPCKIKNLNGCASVLQKLVAKEKLNHFVVSLHASNEGYTVGVQIHGIDEIIETMKLPYEENQLLEYIDSEELPPFLVDLIENTPLSSHKLFHDGCVICEVRDYRRSAPSFSHYFSSQWVLLRPTTQSITNDIINLIANNSSEYIWTNEDKVALEAQIVLHTSPQLCLDPSPSVAILNSKLMRKKRMFRENHIIKLAKKCSQVTVNHVKKFESLPSPKCLKLHEFLKNRTTGKPKPQIKNNKQIFPIVDEFPKDLTPIRNIGVENYAKILPKLQITSDNSLIKVEEYVMEFIDDNRRSVTNVSIHHRPNDDTYFGQLFIDKQGQLRGSTCTFQLGTKQATKRYVDQFTEILTENGRKSVKITHQIPGQAPQVTYTPAASASGMTTSATKDPLDDEGMSLGATPPKKSKLSIGEQSAVPPISSPLIQSPPLMSPITTASTPITVKPMETIPLTIPPKVFSPPSQPTVDKTTPLLTSGVQATAGSAPITESALAVILTPNTGIAKSIQSIDSSESTHQPITTTTPLPTGVSLASLSLAPVQQNLRLHNLVSLTSQGMVPISLMMTTPTGQPSIMTTPGSMIVSLEPSGTQQKDDENVTVTYASTPTTVLMSTGAGPNNVLSVPIGMAGSLGVNSFSAQFITNQLKQTTGQIRASTPQVSLLQMNNNPTVPLLRPLAPHTLAPSSSSTTFSQIQPIQAIQPAPNTPHQIQPLTPQQQLTNALRKQAQQQQIQLVTQKTPRKRQPKK